jgi:GNAT superfamily N-acetyltransferase
MITLKKVEPVHDVTKLANLAHEIWFEYWPERIGIDQTRYMVNKFQSEDALRHAIKSEGYEYYFVEDEQGKTVGYTGIACERFSEDPANPKAREHSSAITDKFADRLFISKIYLLKEERGKHYASQIIAKLAEYAQDQHLLGMYLTVNKENTLGIRAYEGNGFEIISAEASDIGEGFIMDDYIMARPSILH